MATLERIKEKALKENGRDIVEWVTGKLFQMRSNCSNKVDVKTFNTGDIPASLVEEYCDRENIPCYPVCLDVVTLALSYRQLLKYEEQR